MADQKLADSPVRIIGSRELHQNLPGILNELEHPDVRYVLTVHGKPRAVLIGAEPFLRMARDQNHHPSEALVGLQLSALLGNDLDSLSLEDLEKVFHSNANVNASAKTNVNKNSNSKPKPKPK